MSCFARVLAATAAVFVCACASGTPSADLDASDGDPGVDAATDGSSLGQFWDECIEHSECESGLCYYENETDESGHCTEECTGHCPDGFACKVVQIADFTDIRVCIPADDTFCEVCEANVDCGDSGDFCVDLTGAMACTIDCANDADVCPVGFTCQTVAGTGDTVVGKQCMPTSGICCIDADGDLRGEGSGCLGPDCDDEHEEVYDDAEEVCDGFDNDCVGGIDVNVIDCESGECKLGALGYYERAAEPCTDGTCDEQSAVLCNLYTCSGAGETGDECATSCDVEVDDKCIPAAHCDASVCYDDLADGQSCDENTDCTSDHCKGDGGDVCCPFGDCCLIPQHCPTYGTQDPVCENYSTCQGTRGEAVCNTNFTCGTTGTADDDSACTAADVADTCGLYPSVYCNGMEVQTAPSCATSCASHANCDPEGFCHPTSHTCVPDRPDGEACGTDSATCLSGYCANGFCCTSALGDDDCCGDKADCPGSYTSDPVCTIQPMCQGEQDVGDCVLSRCETVTTDNDSDCDGTVLASDCGLYPDYYCTGGVDQGAPNCADTCATDAGCETFAYCSLAGFCVPDELDGQMCNDGDGLGDNECESGHCQNGFCCVGAGMDCCHDNNDCLAYAVPADCYDTASCQGHHTDGVCNASNQCAGQLVEDDSICNGVEADNCGLYPSVYCNGDVVQSAPACATTCADDGDCDATAHCEAPTCVSDAGQGDSCEFTSDCQGGLFCVDGVCCATICSGDCEACDLSPGGVCELVGNNQDPDDECNGVSCTSYYYGWVGDTCYRRADLNDAQMMCDGTGDCRTAAMDCPSSGQGSAQVTCNGVCQSPNMSTCSGTTPGSCTTGTPGTQTTNYLANPYFDSGPGNPPWYQYSYEGWELILQLADLPTYVTSLVSSPYAVWMGGYYDGDDVLYQDVTIPADATNLRINFYYWIFTTEGSGDWDYIYVELRNASTGALLRELVEWTNQDETSGWTYVSFDPPEVFAGQTIRLYFHMTTDFSGNTNFHVDSVQLNVDQPTCL